MQVTAFATPSDPDWRWRIVNYAGDVVEESRGTYRTIRDAVAEGSRRLKEMDVSDTSQRGNPYRPTWRLRG